ncbi:MAG: endonuclease/exonuclease/phosphatase family protein [Halofilum sp. (in: g-proteobacteria)]
MHPLRLSICTYNLWNDQRWPERERALREFLARFSPDVFGVQELCPATRDCIDSALSGHARVEDDFTGWHHQGNLWWRRDILEYVEHGAAEYGSHDPSRGLFWARLRRADTGATVVASTAHLSHTSRDEETATGQSPRVDQARATVAALAEIVAPGEPAWFMGDFNDPYHPSSILHAAGYSSCFADLALQPPPTFPALPTAARALDGHLSNSCYDWITANAHTRAIAAHSPHMFCGDLAPSDHWPIVAVYELGAGTS